MDLSPAAEPNADCPTCLGDGVIVVAKGDGAHASVCSCVPVCRRCQQTGRVAFQEGNETLMGRCLCQRLVDRVQMFNQSGIPARYAHASLRSFMAGGRQFNDPQKTKAVMKAFEWLGTFNESPTRASAKGLILHGPVGRGKTHLLIGIIRTLIFQHGIPARFIEFSRLLSKLKEGYGQGRSDTDLLGDLAKVPVLGIDELGKGRMTDWELTIIDEVISRRYNAMSCTLGTTNYRPTEATGALPPNAAQLNAEAQTLGDRIGPRVFSRVQEMASFVEVGGLDFRKLELKSHG